MPRVLIVDDEPVILKVFAKFLEKPGREVLCAASLAEALALARKAGPLDVALLDKNLGDGSGLDLARQLRELHADLEVLLVTGYASLQSAIEAVQIGAYDYLTKPVDDPTALSLKVANAEEKVRLARERRRLAGELSESEARYRTLFESSPDALLAFDPATGRVRQANRAAGQVFGRPAGLAGADVADLFEGPPPGLATPPGGFAVMGRRADGTGFEAEIRPGAFSLGSEELQTLAVRDVSARERLARERRQVEEQLRQAQKMDAIGRLAGGLGHDLGNMLAVIMTYVEMTHDRVEGSLREDLEVVQGAAERASSLVRQLMHLARPGKGSPTAMTLNDGVGEAVRLLRRSLPEDVQLRTGLCTGPWPILLDPSHLAQVLLNLCVNARDAMPGGGIVTVSTDNLAAEAPRPPGVPPGDWALLSVADTGIGMSAEVRQRLFEPFFTTKEAGKGTGLGLSVVYGIVRQAGGFASVDSAPGQGATFRLGFPRHLGPAPRPRSAERLARELSGRGRAVLVVEDEPALRGAVAHALAAVGYQVLQADGAEAALAVARAHAGTLDLLLTDVVMPGRSGPQLAEALRAERPGIRVLFMTGFPGDPRAAQAAEEAGATGLLQKPFQSSTLIGQVRQILGA